MSNDIRLWVIILVRGIVAVLAGLAILVVPGLATTTMLLPVAMVVAIVAMAVYGMGDSLLVFTISFLTTSRIARYALRIQGLFGIVVGALFFSILIDRVHLHWFLYLIALQALCTGISEWLVARHALTPATTLWDHVAAVVALLCAALYLTVAIVLGDNFEPRAHSWLLFTYLFAFGAAQLITSLRMLLADYQGSPERPAASIEQGTVADLHIAETRVQQ